MEGAGGAGGETALAALYPRTHSGSSTGLLSGDALLNLVYSLPTPYAQNATFVMNRKTLGVCRTLKDGIGQYLWNTGLQPGLPNTLCGLP